ncbi:uncharacterized protein [Dermacentor albipictus]|uniref:uncharacterized protein n=1 Tax=Dermacentor albipictus TaxID=60249 RepID=UPI0038FCD328
MTATTTEGLEPIDITHPEGWEDYAERFQFFLEAQEVTDASKKRSTFPSRCGPATFQLARALLAPAQLKDTPFETTAPNESAAAYLAALRTTAQHCNFNDLDTVQRDQFVFGLQNDTVKRRLLAKKEVSFTSAVEEAVAAEAIAREASLASFQTTNAPRFEPVRQGTTTGDDGEQDTAKDVLRLRASPTQRQDTEILVGGPCASCGGPHERRLCRFRGAQCRECGKTGHILISSAGPGGSLAHFEMPDQARTQQFKTTPRTNISYCDDLAVTAMNEVSKPAKRKIHDFASVFDGTLGCYKGPPVQFALNPEVVPIHLKDKCSINKALQQHSYPVPAVTHLLASLSGGTVFAKLDLAQAYQQLPVTDESAEA